MNANLTRTEFITVGLDDNQQVILDIRTNDGLNTTITISHDRAKLISKLLKFITSKKMTQDKICEGEFENEK